MLRRSRNLATWRPGRDFPRAGMPVLLRISAPIDPGRGRSVEGAEKPTESGSRVSSERLTCPARSIASQSSTDGIIRWDFGRVQAGCPRLEAF